MMEIRLQLEIWLTYLPTCVLMSCLLQSFFFFSFALFPACSSMETLALRYSVPYFSGTFLGTLRIEWRKSTPRSASTPERRNKNIKYFSFTCGNQTHDLSCCATTGHFNFFTIYFYIKMHCN